MTASTFTENTINANHNVRYTGVVVPINSKVRASVWIARGTGTNNRYVRMWVTDSGATYGFYTELDLQAGTAAIAVALGSGRVSGGTDSISITPVASGFNVTVTGIFSITLSGSPVVWMSSETAPNAFFYTGSGTQSFAYESVGLCVFS
jgi:hypothetical protein